MQGPLHTFSIGFDTRRSAMEALYNTDQETAEVVSAQIGTQHHNIVIPDDQETIDQLDEMIAALDEPVWEPSYLSIYRMAQEARQQSVKVLLTGDGADELFGGYPWHRGGLTLDRVNKLPLLRPFLKLNARVLPSGALKIRFEDLAAKYRQDAATVYLENYAYIDYATRCQMLQTTIQQHPDATYAFIQALL
jgi:asparagine synthase (glutamine-hydrolysing)